MPPTSDKVSVPLSMSVSDAYDACLHEFRRTQHRFHKVQGDESSLVITAQKRETGQVTLGTVTITMHADGDHARAEVSAQATAQSLRSLRSHPATRLVDDAVAVLGHLPHAS